MSSAPAPGQGCEVQFASAHVRSFLNMDVLASALLESSYRAWEHCTQLLRGMVDHTSQPLGLPLRGSSVPATCMWTLWQHHLAALAGLASRHDLLCCPAHTAGLTRVSYGPTSLLQHTAVELVGGVVAYVLLVRHRADL